MFIAARLAETGGDYLVCRWLRERAPVIASVLGAIIIGAYTIILRQSVRGFAAVGLEHRRETP